MQEKKCENPLIWKIHFSLLPNYHIASSFELDHPKKRLLIAKFLKKAYQNCHEILSFETFLQKINVKHMKNTLLEKIQLRRWQVEKQQNNVTGRSRQSFPPPNFSSLYPVMGLTPIFFEIVSLSLVALMH